MTIVSNLGVMNFKNPDRVMQLQSYHPGHSIDEIRKNTGFDLRIAPDVIETPIPGPQIVDMIRAMDPDGLRTSEFG